MSCAARSVIEFVITFVTLAGGVHLFTPGHNELLYIYVAKLRISSEGKCLTYTNGYKVDMAIDLIHFLRIFVEDL